MKKILALSAAALMSTSLIAAPALAQVSVDVGGGVGVNAGSSPSGGGADVGADVGVGVGTDGSGVRLGAEADTGVELDTDSTTAAIGADFNSALSAMGRSGDSAATIGSMTEVSSVNVVRVNDLAGLDMDALGNAQTENSAGIDELRASLDSNAAVKAALDAQSIGTGDVIGADVAADGSLTVFVR